MSDFVWKIEEVYNNIFEYLLNKYFEEKKEGRDFFFYIKTEHRPKPNNRFLDSDRNAIVLTFWAYDVITGTIHYSIELVIEMKAIYLLFGSQDQEFDLLAERIPGLQNSIENHKWQKNYTDRHSGDYIKYLNAFIVTDKEIIDDYFETKEHNYEIKLNEELLDEQSRKIVKDDFYQWLTVMLRMKYETGPYYRESDSLGKNRIDCIKSLEVRNYNGIEYLRIKDIPTNTKWIVLTGENGYGKTTILQSIIIGLAGTMDGSNQLLDDTGTVFVEGKFEGRWDINMSFNYNSNRAFTSTKNRIVAYGANRLSADFTTMESGSRLFGSIFPPYTGLININDELKDANSYYPKRFQLLKETFCRIISDLHDIKIDTESGKPIVKYIEHDPDGNEYKEVTFEQLASGFRNIIAIVGDIISRLFREHVDNNNLADLRGFVIIDEFELHLHPKYQKCFPKILTELFPNVLFIVATHSPIPLLGMPKETVILHVNRTKEKGITAERLDIDFTNLLPNSILSSPIFDFQEFLPSAHENGKKIRTEDDYADVLFNKKLESKVEEIKEKYSKK